MSRKTKIDIDLICGMEVPIDTQFTLDYKGKTYYFCSLGCQEHFKNNPEIYTGK